MRRRLRTWLPVLALGLIAAAPQAEVTGLWLDESGKAAIDVQPCGAALCGRILWLREPLAPEGGAKRDIHNTDPAQRNRPLCALPMLDGFTPAGAGAWDGGRIYNPEDGATYHATLRLQADGTLLVRGYVGIPLFGKSQVWTRPTTALPPCRA